MKRINEQDSQQPHGLPNWAQSIGTRLRHHLNGEMTDMPESLLLTLLTLFRREEGQAEGEPAGSKEAEPRVRPRNED